MRRAACAAVRKGRTPEDGEDPPSLPDQEISASDATSKAGMQGESDRGICADWACHRPGCLAVVPEKPPSAFRYRYPRLRALGFGPGSRAVEHLKTLKTPRNRYFCVPGAARSRKFVIRSPCLRDRFEHEQYLRTRIAVVLRLHKIRQKRQAARRPAFRRLVEPGQNNGLAGFHRDRRLRARVMIVGESMLLVVVVAGTGDCCYLHGNTPIKGCAALR